MPGILTRPAGEAKNITSFKLGEKKLDVAETKLALDTKLMKFN